ncbi:hypothetical protein TNIN_191201 [Trichonephila inaurata madagascariensis]|uniref:Uncharacterized protein n=1 Tax=Trichonephila inaurata madagascariensis TaxID=2747483 RepID=A0A8X6XC73_9ARAC|nr:hypothetical protein TNIN_191201 [Trichonephila inaurata madagascariensis]
MIKKVLWSAGKVVALEAERSGCVLVDRLAVNLICKWEEGKVLSPAYKFSLVVIEGNIAFYILKQMFRKENVFGRALVRTDGIDRVKMLPP